MKPVWTITAVVALFGVAAGLIIVGVPQAALAAGLASGAVGLVGSSGPLGYAAGCLAFGRLPARLPARHVLLGGVTLTLLGTLGLSASRSTAPLAACQILVGVAGGAFWPFASAWLLEYRSEGIARTRLLRHYNVAWTVGTSAGMVASGWLCRAGWVFESFRIAAAVLAGVLALALFPRSAHQAPAEAGGGGPAAAPRTGTALLLAALVANVIAVGTRSMIPVSYAELNRALGFEADRMGLITGTSILAMMGAFALGTAYESRLGLRRVYALMTAAVVATLLAFAFLTPLPALLVGAVAAGTVNAVAFQGSILAATGRFAGAPRRGTSLHEAMIGLGGMFPLAGGLLVSELKARDVAPIDALRSPFILLAALAAAALIVQLLLISGSSPRRLLHETSRAKTAVGMEGGTGVERGA